MEIEKREHVTVVWDGELLTVTDVILIQNTGNENYDGPYARLLREGTEEEWKPLLN